MTASTMIMIIIINNNNNNDDVDCFPQQDKQPILQQQDTSPTTLTAANTSPSLIESPMDTNPPIPIIPIIPIIITMTAPTIIMMMIARSFTTTNTVIRMTTGKKTRSTVLNPRRAKEFVVPSTLTRCIAS